MRLTARIKRKISPVTRLARRLSSGRPMIIVDPMGDSKLLRRLMIAAQKAGRLNDFYQVTAKPAGSVYSANFG